MGLANRCSHWSACSSFSSTRYIGAIMHECAVFRKPISILANGPMNSNQEAAREVRSVRLRFGSRRACRPAASNVSMGSRHREIAQWQVPHADISRLNL